MLFDFGHLLQLGTTGVCTLVAPQNTRLCALLGGGAHVAGDLAVSYLVKYGSDVMVTLSDTARAYLANTPENASSEIVQLPSPQICDEHKLYEGPQVCEQHHEPDPSFLASVHEAAPGVAGAYVAGVALDTPCTRLAGFAPVQTRPLLHVGCVLAAQLVGVKGAETVWEQATQAYSSCFANE